MKAVWILAKKEVRSFFDSLIAYVLLVAFLGVTGLFTWLIVTDIFLGKEATLSKFFEWANWALLVFIPAITMKMLAEENKSGTIELLLTKPITNWQVLWGKFLACFMLILFALICTIPYYITVACIGQKIDHGVVISGYFGTLIVSAAYIAMGILASSFTNNQVIAFLIALVLGLFFKLIMPMLASMLTGSTGLAFDYLSFDSHYGSIKRGVIDSRDIVYFGSIVLVSMVLSELSLAKRTLSE